MARFSACRHPTISAKSLALRVGCVGGSAFCLSAALGLAYAWDDIWMAERYHPNRSFHMRRAASPLPETFATPGRGIPWVPTTNGWCTSNPEELCDSLNHRAPRLVDVDADGEPEILGLVDRDDEQHVMLIDGATLRPVWSVGVGSHGGALTEATSRAVLVSTASKELVLLDARTGAEQLRTKPAGEVAVLCVDGDAILVTMKEAPHLKLEPGARSFLPYQGPPCAPTALARGGCRTRDAESRKVASSETCPVGDVDLIVEGNESYLTIKAVPAGTNGSTLWSVGHEASSPGARLDNDTTWLAAAGHEAYLNIVFEPGYHDTSRRDEVLLMSIDTDAHAFRWRTERPAQPTSGASVTSSRLYLGGNAGLEVYDRTSGRLLAWFRR